MTEELRDWAKAYGLPDAVIQTETEKWVIRERTKPRRSADAESSLRRWLLQAVEYRRGRGEMPPDRDAQLRDWGRLNGFRRQDGESMADYMARVRGAHQRYIARIS